MPKYQRRTSESSSRTALSGDTTTITLSPDEHDLYATNTRTYLDFEPVPRDTYSTLDSSNMSDSRWDSDELHTLSVFDKLKKIFEMPKRHIDSRKRRFEREEVQKTECLALFQGHWTTLNETIPLIQRESTLRHDDECIDIKQAREQTCKLNNDQSVLHINCAHNYSEEYSNSMAKRDMTEVYKYCCSKHCDTLVKDMHVKQCKQDITDTCQTELSYKYEDEANPAMCQRQNLTDSEECVDIVQCVNTKAAQLADEIDGKQRNVSDESTKAITEQETTIQNLQTKHSHQLFGLECGNVFRLSKKYINLKKLFVALAVINIILIICVVSVLPVILVTFKMSYDREGKSDRDIKHLVLEQLSSSEGKQMVSSFIYCVSCSSLDRRLTKLFKESTDHRCCIENIAKAITFFTNLTDQKTKECSSRLNDLEGEQGELQSQIVRLKMLLLNKSDVDINVDWPKHPGIQKNNKLVNILLTRRRSAIHLNGVGKKGGIDWTAAITEGKVSYDGNGIYVENGGMYYMYCNIRFKKTACGSNGKIGYDFKRKSGTGPSVAIASVYNHCSNGTNYDQDLIIQRVFKLSVGHKSSVLIDIGEHGHRLVAEDYLHAFGVLEL